MVEELKLAIKVDDDAIEQSLLKQFANAEKMANKVVLTFNNIDLDNKAIEAKFKEMQKMAGKNPIDLSIDKSSIEMLSAISKQLGNIFDIAKGKSIIDSSATAQIDKLQSKLDELTKKYDELSSKKIGSTVSGKDIDLVDNEKFKSLSENFEKIKRDIDELRTHMSLLDDYTVDSDSFLKLETQVDGLSVKIDDLIGKYIELSNVQKNIGTDKSNISSKTQMKDVLQGDDKVNTDASTTAIKEESQALENVSASAKDAATSKEKFANANKEVKASADETAISVDKEISALEKAGNRFESQAAGLAIKPDDQHQFSSWKKQLEDLNIEIAEYKSKVENLPKIDIADEAQINKAKTEIEELGNSIKDAITSMKNVPQASRGWNQTGVDKLIQRMNDDLKKNSKYTDETKQKIQGLIDELNNIPDRPLSEVFNDFSRFKREAHDAGKEGKAFFEIFKEKVIYGGAAQLAGMVGFYDVINVGREAFNVIKDLDSAYTEMRKVSDETAQSLKNFQSASFDVAKQVGVTALEIQNSAADFMRLGYSLKEASKLSEDANIYANVGDMDISEATEHMISSIQAWQSEFSSVTEASTNIIDRYNEVNFLPLCA